MTRAARWAPPALVLLLAACAGPRPPAYPGPRLADPDSETRVAAVIEAAIVGDTRGPVADTLYSPGSTVVANGQTRLSTPRLAGVLPGGQAAVTSSELSVREGFAWALLDYRWFSEDKSQVRLGRATLVLAPKKDGKGWWIVHAHSSSSR
ncbi:MAG TPA: hypothetical protein VFX50_05240 [Gemmatimonadales bacterium]|nr:hypothetical protein [Gemmatimonadales bacterium]